MAVIESGGNTKLLTEIKEPKSTEQLQANLTSVTAQIKIAQVQGKAPNPDKVGKLSNALSSVIQKNPQLPEAWQAASALISYSAAGIVPSNENQPCGGEKTIAMIGNHGGVGLHYLYCTVMLDDAPAITESPQYQSLANYKEAAGKFTLRFENVHVIYRGGPIIRADQFQFINCTFEFQIYIPPPARGRALTDTLLQAKNIHAVTFTSDQPIGL